MIPSWATKKALTFMSFPWESIKGKAFYFITASRSLSSQKTSRQRQ